jgi:uracil-DNA glycosylase
MAENPTNWTREEIARQIRQQTEAWQAAGVEWLPRTVGMSFSMPSEPGEAAAESLPVAGSASLFAGTEPEVTDADIRRVELGQLQTKVAGCTRCLELASSRTQTVFGSGPMDVDICFIGEAPGADEDRQGQPFVGVAGQLLTRIITAMGMKREEVYICNILKCRPPGNRQPKPDECKNCREYLDAQLDLVRPRFICALGAVAAQNLLGTTTPIGKMRGRFYEYRGIPVLCTYHPASLLPSRSPEKKKDVWEDMKMLLAKMGRPVPGK